MEVKQKAEYLIDRFMPFSDYNECDVFIQRENQLNNAKECALICADEIIKEYEEDIEDNIYPIEYWNNVKEEIKAWQ